MADLGSQKSNTTVPADPVVAKSPARITASPVSAIEDAQVELKSIGLLEFLDVDDRPTFILDLTSSPKSTSIYHNDSLQQISVLETRIVKGDSGTLGKDVKFALFSEWTVSPHKAKSHSSTTYAGFKWTARTIQSRWRVISGEPRHIASDLDPRRPSEHRLPRSQTGLQEKSRHQSRTPNPQDLDAQLAAFRLRRDEELVTFPSNAPDVRASLEYGAESPSGSEASGLLDWTRPNSSVDLTGHVKFIAEFDWGKTDLGPMASWSTDLRRMCTFLMSDPRPAAMYWSKRRIMIYNEPYVAIMGQKHPGMIGKPFSEAWAEVDSEFSPAFDRVHETGKAYTIEEARFYLERHGYLEESYFTPSIVPINTDSGEMAFYNPVYEITKQVIADRRMANLLRVGQYINSCREPKDFWGQLLLGLDTNSLDLPFAILYSAGGDVNETLSESSEMSQQLRNWVLEGVVKVPDSCTALPRRITTERSMEEFLPNFSELVRIDSATLLQEEDGSLPEFIKNDIKIKMDGELYCDEAVFLPIRSTIDNVLGFLIIGINPRRTYDDAYRVFIELLNRQLNTSIASAVLFEEEIRRERMAAEQAAKDKSLLSKKLAMTTHEALEVETRFRRMADLAPVGMFHISPEGVLLYANNDYYTMTEHGRDVQYAMSWYGVIAEIDHPVMDVEWAKLVSGQPVNFELRLKRQFIAEELVGGEKVEGFTWIIAAAYPEKNEDGVVIGILGCITDISRQKWMEGFQTRKMLEAVELKRQQENFIDMTSHEMRNPLSAIIQCADWINTSLTEFNGDTKNVTIPREAIDGYADAAQTVILCAMHQKRIIDDILTLSKLDSDLLLITPIEARPVSVIENALKMFDNELQKSDVELRFLKDPSYTALSVEWVKIDPSRLLQVLINLTTNAIKFTQPEPTRRIHITLAASEEPPKSDSSLEYLPRGSTRKDLSLGTAWGDGEMLFLRVEVTDTGPGLDEHERNLLFKRFSQASPRTHVQYGGSGLGLFISRELTELQGGQIGVASTTGVGSTFAFYVRARRCDPPVDTNPLTPNMRTVDMRAQSKIISPAALARVQNGFGPESPPNEKKVDEIPKLEPKAKHVLIVEDNIVNQKVLSKQLRSAGCIVHVANHGLEALSFLATTHFSNTCISDPIALDVILMDLEMPIMDGLTCVRKIREMQTSGEIRKHVPVIAVTANARSAQIAVAKDAGMDSVVTKPFRIPELLPEMERQIERVGGGKKYNRDR